MDEIYWFRLVLLLFTDIPFCTDFHKKPAEPELQNELNFTLDIVRNHLRCEQYIPSYILAKQLGISNLTLSKISSSMFVYNKSSDSKVNLGLNLKFDSKQRKVLGYTNKVAAGWQYSQRAKDLLMDYRVSMIFLSISRYCFSPFSSSFSKNSFPQFFDRLDKSAQRDMFQDTDFYSAEAATIKINEMKSFLKKAGVKDFEKVPLESVNITKVRNLFA